MEQLELFDTRIQIIKQTLRLLVKSQIANKKVRSDAKEEKKSVYWFNQNDYQKRIRRGKIRKLHLVDNFLRKVPYKSVERYSIEDDRPSRFEILEIVENLGLGIDKEAFYEWYK